MSAPRSSARRAWPVLVLLGEHARHGLGDYSARSFPRGRSRIWTSPAGLAALAARCSVSCTEDGVRVEIGWVLAVPEDRDLGADRGLFGAQLIASAC